MTVTEQREIVHEKKVHHGALFPHQLASLQYNFLYGKNEAISIVIVKEVLAILF